MSFKHFLVSLTLGAIVLTGCSVDDPLSTSSSSDSHHTWKGTSVIAAAQPARVTQTRIRVHPYCQPPARDCFTTVVVRPDNLVDISNLNDAIQNGTQASFFSNSANWNSIWSSIPSAIVSDITAGRSKLVVCESSTPASYQWAIVDANGGSVDYSLAQ